MTAEKPRATIDEIKLADDPEHWEALGFTISNNVLRLGTACIALAGNAAGRGILGWSLRTIASTDLDGLPTSGSQAPQHPAMTPEQPHAEHPQTEQHHPERHHTEHPNGVSAIDHIVAMSPNLDRTVQALQAAGLDLRRIREQPTPAGAPRQAFFRLGEVILEVVQEPDDVLAARSDGANGPARFWGLALLTDDLDCTVERLGEHSSEIRDAVQPGRRIATLRRSAGLSVPVALMSRAVA
jgi:hypothetical protein